MVLPYLVWSVITLAIAVFAFDGDCLEQAKLILLCQEGIIVPLASCHIWFVYPYLIISLLGYYLYKAYKKHSFKFVLTYTAVIALALIVLDKCLHLEYQLLRDVMVYSIFYVYGFTYKKTEYKYQSVKFFPSQTNMAMRCICIRVTQYGCSLIWIQYISLNTMFA